MHTKRFGTLYLLNGTIALIGGFLLYLYATPIFIAMGISVAVIGLYLLLKGIPVLPSALKNSLYLVFGFLLVIEGGNLLWDIALPATQQQNGTFYLPFMAISMPWYVAGDLVFL